MIEDDDFVIHETDQHLMESFIVFTEKKDGSFFKNFEYKCSQDLKLPADFSQFCFPYGRQNRRLRRTDSGSALNNLLFNQSNIHNYIDSSFILRFQVEGKNLKDKEVDTDSAADADVDERARDEILNYFYTKNHRYGILYGVCVEKLELVARPPLFSLDRAGEPVTDEEGRRLVKAEEEDEEKEEKKEEEKEEKEEKEDEERKEKDKEKEKKMFRFCDEYFESEEYRVTKRCYCLLSHIPLFLLHFQVLHTLLQLEVAAKTEYEQRFSRLQRGDGDFDLIRDRARFLRAQRALVARVLTSYRTSRVASGGFLRFSAFSYALPPFQSATQVEGEVAAEWSAVNVFRAFSLDCVLYLLHCLLLEKRVVVLDGGLGGLSSLVLGLELLCRPLDWKGLVISVLPAKLLSYLGAPVPYLIGVPVSTLKEFLALDSPVFDGEERENTVIVEAERGRVLCWRGKKLAVPETRRRRHGNSFAPALLPEYWKLHDKLADPMARLHALKLKRNRGLLHGDESEKALVRACVDVVYHYMSWLIGKVQTSYSVSCANHRWDSKAERTPEEVAVLKKEFLKAVHYENRKFVRTFLESQHLNSFLF